MSGQKAQSFFSEMGSYWRFGTWVIASISKHMRSRLSQLLWNWHLSICSYSQPSLWLSAIGLASRSLPPFLSLPPFQTLLMTDSGFALISGPKKLTSDIIPAANVCATGTPYRWADSTAGIGNLWEVWPLYIPSTSEDVLSTSGCQKVATRALKSFQTPGSALPPTAILWRLGGGLPGNSKVANRPKEQRRQLPLN